MRLSGWVLALSAVSLGTAGLGCGGTTTSKERTICYGTIYFPATTGTATISGALTGTVNIRALGGGSPGDFLFRLDSTNSPPLLQFIGLFEGNLSQPTGTFTNLGSANATTTVQAEIRPDGNAPIWVQETLLGDNGGSVGPGSFRLTITSFGPLDAGDGGIGSGYYPTHGTLFADAVPVATGSGRYMPNPATEDVMVCASF